MVLSTLWPGNWPPSPGLAPCAILICIMSELTRYSAVTPKRPEATCLIAERMRSPFGSGLKRSALLAAFAGVRLAADPVHGDGERGVRLARDRAERHRAGREAPHDGLGRLDLLDRHGLAVVLVGALDAEQAADGDQRVGLLVQDLGEGAVLLIGVAAHGVLQRRDRGGSSRRGPRRARARRSRRRRRACCGRSARRRRRRDGGAPPLRRSRSGRRLRCGWRCR